LSRLNTTRNNARLVGMLAWQDVVQRYRRSIIGQFWITISMAITVLCLGFLFGALFKVPYKNFLPFLAMGLILWGLISNTLTEAGAAFTNATNIIRQIKLPGMVYVARVVWRNLIVFAHNIVIIPILFLVIDVPVGTEFFLAVPGMVLLSANLLWMSYMLGLFCTRFRDLPQMVQSALQIAFYVTPIIWMPNLLSGRAEAYVLGYNPFFHLIELVRAPVLGQAPTLENWLVGLGLLVIGWALTFVLANKFSHRVAYWL
jgi:ABC-type polysaccharide/polyol phosphate export permease